MLNSELYTIPQSAKKDREPSELLEENSLFKAPFKEFLSDGKHKSHFGDLRKENHLSLEPQLFGPSSKTGNRD